MSTAEISEDAVISEQSKENDVHENIPYRFTVEQDHRCRELVRIVSKIVILHWPKSRIEMEQVITEQFGVDFTTMDESEKEEWTYNVYSISWKILDNLKSVLKIKKTRTMNSPEETVLSRDYDILRIWAEYKIGRRIIWNSEDFMNFLRNYEEE